jgi:hypothetical protein
VSIVLYDRVAGVDSAAVLNHGLLGMMISYATVALVFAVFGLRGRGTEDTRGADGVAGDGSWADRA